MKLADLHRTPEQGKLSSRAKYTRRGLHALVYPSRVDRGCGETEVLWVPSLFLAKTRTQEDLIDWHELSIVGITRN
jgi:hypothetical protein